jgi:hypothetical protein
METQEESRETREAHQLESVKRGDGSGSGHGKYTKKWGALTL